MAGSKYVQEATREVDSLIASGHAINRKARNQAIREYSTYLKNLDREKTSAVKSMDSMQEVDRARMSNRLAARGLSGDGGMQFNFGRLNAEHEGQNSKLRSEYMNKRGELLMNRGKQIDSINSQDDALSAARTSKIGELARALEDRDWARRLQAAQEARANAAEARARAAFNHERDGWDKADDPYAAMAADAIKNRQLAPEDGQLLPSSLRNAWAAKYKIDVVEAAQRGDTRALELVKLLYPKTTDYRVGGKPWSEYGKSTVTPRISAPGTLSPSSTWDRFWDGSAIENTAFPQWLGNSWYSLFGKQYR